MRETGLCAPDIALLEPLANIFEISISELVTGEREKKTEEREQSACISETEEKIKTVLDYSECEIKEKTNRIRTKYTAALVCILCAIMIIIPILNGWVYGEGFAWRCIPAYLCAEKAAQAIKHCDETGIEKYIGNAEGVYDALVELEQQGVDILDTEVRFSRVHLDDMFLHLEVELLVKYDTLKYQFTCRGTYRAGKVEFMNIISLNVGDDYPEWMISLSDALSTYDPG